MVRMLRLLVESKAEELTVVRGVAGWNQDGEEQKTQQIAFGFLQLIDSGLPLPKPQFGRRAKRYAHDGYVVSDRRRGHKISARVSALKRAGDSAWLHREKARQSRSQEVGDGQALNAHGRQMAQHGSEQACPHTRKWVKNEITTLGPKAI